MRSKSILVLALHLAGCSVVTSARPPAEPSAEGPSCEPQTRATRIDFIGAAVAAVAGLTMLVAGAATTEDADNPNPLPDGKQMNGLMMGGALSLAFVVPAFAASGGYGMIQTRKCREAQEALERGGSGPPGSYDPVKRSFRDDLEEADGGGHRVVEVDRDPVAE